MHATHRSNFFAIISGPVDHQYRHQIYSYFPYKYLHGACRDTLYQIMIAIERENLSERKGSTLSFVFSCQQVRIPKGKHIQQQKTCRCRLRMCLRFCSTKASMTCLEYGEMAWGLPIGNSFLYQTVTPVWWIYIAHIWGEVSPHLFLVASQELPFGGGSPVMGKNRMLGEIKSHVDSCHSQQQLFRINKCFKQTVF